MMHEFDKTILRHYDIRGIINETFSREDCYFIGRSFGTIMRRRGLKTVVVGFDGRRTSLLFAYEVRRGLNESGIDVINLGLGPSPYVYFAMTHLGADASVVITGSHSPINYNGIKFGLNPKPFYGDGILEIGRVASSGDFEEGAGTNKEVDIRDDYVSRLAYDYNHSKELTVAWDNGNGAGGEIVRRLTAKLPGKHILLFDEIDGTYPNHHPDPSVDKNMRDLQRAVRENNCDLGVALDGDADRIGMVDERGNILRADTLMCIYAKAVLKDYPGATIIADVKSSRVLFDEVERLGGNPFMSATGGIIIKDKVQELNSPLGGELAGHICFADKYYGFDDGIYCAIRMMDILSNTNNKLSDMTAVLPKMMNTPEIRFKVEESRKFDVPKEIKKRLLNDNTSGVSISDIDGVRVTTSEGWWLIRTSNTEDLLTIRAEAFDIDGLGVLKGQIVEQLNLSGIPSPF